LNLIVFGGNVFVVHLDSSSANFELRLFLFITFIEPEYLGSLFVYLALQKIYLDISYLPKRWFCPTKYQLFSKLWVYSPSWQKYL